MQRRNRIIVWLVVTAAAVSAPFSRAQAPAEPMRNVEALRQRGASVTSIAPVFSQLLAFSLPTGFSPVFENTSERQYIQESIPAGETVEKWSQMITITGEKDAAAISELTPQVFAARMAGAMRRLCPDSHSAASPGGFKISGYNAFLALVGCGATTAQTGAPHSEVLMVVVIKGEKDYYTVQWAERGPASPTPIKLDDPKWRQRFNALSPIRVCARVPGEAPPYPSCVDQK